MGSAEKGDAEAVTKTQEHNQKKAAAEQEKNVKAAETKTNEENTKEKAQKDDEQESRGRHKLPPHKDRAKPRTQPLCSVLPTRLTSKVKQQYQLLPQCRDCRGCEAFVGVAACLDIVRVMCAVQRCCGYSVWARR